MSIRSTAVAFVAALLLSAAAGADTFETTTRETAVPADALGSLTVRACATCPQKLVRLSADSTFHVGRDEVDHTTFMRFLGGAGERHLNVSYDPGTGLVIRLRVSGRLSERPSRSPR